MTYEKQSHEIKGSERGTRGEARATAFLREQGFTILRRNYRSPAGGEIDIIARNHKYLLFVEVKARGSSTFGGPLYALTPKQLKRIHRGALHFLTSTAGAGLICRFDLITLEGETLSWIKDILR